MWIIAIPIVFIGLYLVYQFVLLPKMNAGQERKLEANRQEFASRIAGREEAVKQQFIQDNEHLLPLVFQTDEQDIIGIISCQEKRETKDFLRQQAINMAGRALGKLTAVGVRELDNTEHYFLVLTPSNLHYLHYSEQGQCKEHIAFDRTKMTDMEVGKITSADMLKNSAFAGQTERLSFISEDTQYKFFFYDKLYAHPSAKDESFENIAEVNYLFAKPFLAFAEQYRRG
ncbi:hypothetical protein [Sphingobacterium bambusae]|uniref:Uncharacterized protein n=1 Tax=Sphingobacterium bambusae TaxID=662858 RepID=A0ABW6BGC8_9SPHI|nr:hypothetical protein [Sphingobacterium bambusae]WPL49526.1 hypothetical protein SCB77_03560 [Sphingobacterium bambusae]